MFGDDYQQGQHVTMLGPTQRGKSYCCRQMLGKVISPEHKCVILAGKPPGRDPGMEDAARELNLREVDEWPPPYNIKDRKLNGYVLRPHQGMRDLDADNANLRRQFRSALMRNYASKKPVITVVDEAYHVQIDLKLKQEYEAALLRGAPVNAEWSLLQRGRYTSLNAYDAAEHILIFFDPDETNVRRYAEFVGGVNPRTVANIVAGLKTERVATGGTISEFLYLKRSGSQMYIVETH